MDLAFLKTGIDMDIASSKVGKNNNLVVTFRDFGTKIIWHKFDFGVSMIC